MNLVELLKENSEELGDGVDKKLVSDLEARLNITIPEDFKKYLIELNYAEIFGDPIYGLNPDMDYIDIYTQNKYEEHFRYGFLAVFTNDIDGTIFIRPDSGVVYNACFEKPLAKSFKEFVEMVLRQS